MSTPVIETPTKDSVVRFVFESLENYGHDISCITANDNLYTDGGLDSLDMMNIVTDLETEYHISIPGERLESLNSINHLAQYVWESLGNKN